MPHGPVRSSSTDVIAVCRFAEWSPRLKAEARPEVPKASASVRPSKPATDAFGRLDIAFANAGFGIGLLARLVGDRKAKESKI